MRFGAKILQSMGWKEGTGLGAKQDGNVEPLKVQRRQENVGIGAEKRPFQDSWWEKLMEDAYGKPRGNDGQKNLLEVCEGRRCRPHGKSKLARIERHDASAPSLSIGKNEKSNGEDSASEAGNKPSVKDVKTAKRKSKSVQQPEELKRKISKKRKPNKEGENVLKASELRGSVLDSEMHDPCIGGKSENELQGSKKFLHLVDQYGATVDDTFSKRLVRLDRLLATMCKANENGERDEDGVLLLTDEEKKLWRKTKLEKIRVTEKKLMKTINKAKKRSKHKKNSLK